MYCFFIDEKLQQIFNVVTFIEEEVTYERELGNGAVPHSPFIDNQVITENKHYQRSVT